jgi:hypothetical protein
LFGGDEVAISFGKASFEDGQAVEEIAARSLKLKVQGLRFKVSHGDKLCCLGGVDVGFDLFFRKTVRGLDPFID